MTTTRLRADYLFGVDRTGTLVADGAIDIDDSGRIVAAGPVADLDDPAGEVVQMPGLLMPGLVNAHAHTPMTLLRSAGDGLPLQTWLTDAVWPREGRMTADDAHAGMVLGSLEMLLSGVTTSCEMYLFEEPMVDAVHQTGARMVMTPGVVSALLPNGDVGPRIDELDEVFARFHRPENRVSVGFGPHSPYDLEPHQVAELGLRARAVGAMVHIHLEETEAERQLVIDRHGRSATQLLADNGVLEGKVLAAHGVWLDDEDLATLGGAGAAVAHCPISNLKLGSGIARVNRMRQAGITVGLGTDGVASNDNLDLWEELKLAPMLARGLDHDATAMDPATALGLATFEAADAVGLGDVGLLAPGYWADVIRVDLDGPQFVPGHPDDLLTHVVFSGSGRYVTDVWVAGEQVVADRNPVKVDLEVAVATCRQRGLALLDLV